MGIKRIRPGKRMSSAVIVGDMVYVSGMVSDAPAGKDIKAQTASALARIDAVLAEAGTDKTRLVSASIWLADIASDFGAMNEVWEAWIAPEQSPARATVEAKLAGPDMKVEIQVTAHL